MQDTQNDTDISNIDKTKHLIEKCGLHTDTEDILFSSFKVVNVDLFSQVALHKKNMFCNIRSPTLLK